jgi:hypothetical protein
VRKLRPMACLETEAEISSASGRGPSAGGMVRRLHASFCSMRVRCGRSRPSPGVACNHALAWAAKDAEANPLEREVGQLGGTSGAPALVHREREQSVGSRSGGRARAGRAGSGQGSRRGGRRRAAFHTLEDEMIAGGTGAGRRGRGEARVRATRGTASQVGVRVCVCVCVMRMCLRVSSAGVGNSSAAVTDVESSEAVVAGRQGLGRGLRLGGHAASPDQRRQGGPPSCAVRDSMGPASAPHACDVPRLDAPSLSHCLRVGVSLVVVLLLLELWSCWRCRCWCSPARSRSPASGSRVGI